MREELTQEDARDEEYRRQEWMQYYVEIGDYASARSLGWDGEPIVAEAAAAGASTQRATTDPNRAATRIQARYRAHARHEKYKDERNEAARLQWIEYYIATKQYDAVRLAAAHDARATRGRARARARGATWGARGLVRARRVVHSHAALALPPLRAARS